MNTRGFVVLAVTLSLVAGFLLGGGPSVVARWFDSPEAVQPPTVSQEQRSFFAAEAQVITRTPTSVKQPTLTPIAEAKSPNTPTSEPEPTRTPRPSRTPTATLEPASPRPTDTPPPLPPAPTETPVPAPIAIIIPGGVNLRRAPNLDAEILQTLWADTSTVALARSSDSQWLQVQLSGEPETVWVFAELVQPDGDLASLPVN